MAAQNAAEQIKDAADRLRRREVLGRPRARWCSSRTASGSATAGSPSTTSSSEAYLGRVHLSAAGFYKTPDIHWDRAAGKGRPFYYFAYGAAVSEVSVDTLTGEYHVDRTDILHDVGRSLNPAVDKGQVEGGFIQGMGWLTTEELWWDDKGRLRTHAPSTYKIPLASDRPAIFNVEARRLVGEPRADDPPLQGGGRAAVHAGGLGARGAVDGGGERRRLPGLPAARRAGDARARPDGDRPAGGGGAMTVRPEAIDRFRGDQGRAALVRVETARGSTPREAGAWMAGRRRSATIGTIGGGQLEYMAIDAARAHAGARRRRGRRSTSRSARRSASAAAAAPCCRSPALDAAGWERLRAVAEAERRGAARGATSSAPATSAARWRRRWRSCRCAPVLVDEREPRSSRLAPPGVERGADAAARGGRAPARARAAPSWC